MPLMIMDNRSKPVRVATTVGHTFLFRPNEPLMVPDHCVGRCVQAGARFVNDGDNTLLETPERQKLSIQRQIELMGELLRDMLVNHRQYVDHFGSNNMPKVAFVNDTLAEKHGGRFQFGSPEVYKAWRQVREEVRADKAKAAVAEEA
jgi:hypothetical protein